MASVYPIHRRVSMSATAAEVRSMLASGMSVPEVAKLRGVSKQSVYDLCTRYGIEYTKPKNLPKLHKLMQCDYCGNDFRNLHPRLYCSKKCEAAGRRKKTAKINQAIAAEMRKMRSDGNTLQVIADSYGVSLGLVQQVIEGRRWKATKGHWTKGKRRSDCNVDEWERIRPRIIVAIKIRHGGIKSLRGLAKLIGVESKTVTRWLRSDRYPMQESVEKIKKWLTHA